MGRRYTRVKNSKFKVGDTACFLPHVSSKAIHAAGLDRNDRLLVQQVLAGRCLVTNTGQQWDEKTQTYQPGTVRLGHEGWFYEDDLDHS